MNQKDKSKAAGGRARAESLPPNKRSEIARNAAEKRWGAPRTAYTGELKIGDMTFPCSVLSDGTRILTQTDFMAGMGMYYSGWVAKNRGQKESSADIPHFLQFKALNPFINKHLGDLQSISVRYRTERGNLAFGIPADIIPKICEVWLDADEHGNLGHRQKKIAAKAKLLMRSLAHVGIIALVDEATGYQRDRASSALAEILEKYIAKELQPWVKTFPDEYYEEIFRLRGMEFPTDIVQRPPYFGHLTNNVIYERLAPAVLEDLKSKTPKDDKGRRKHRFHQKLTPEIGHPKLREHLASAMAVMKLSDNWDDFISKLDRVKPKFNETLPLDFEDHPLPNKGL